jgi:hypothetical protein
LSYQASDKRFLFIVIQGVRFTPAELMLLLFELESLVLQQIAFAINQLLPGAGPSKPHVVSRRNYQHDCYLPRIENASTNSAGTCSHPAGTMGRHEG